MDLYLYYRSVQPYYRNKNEKEKQLRESESSRVK